MNSAHHHTTSWLLESQLAPYVDAFMLHLFDCRYASNTINNYLAGLTHFAHWTTLCNIDVKSIDEKLIQQFLNDHLPRCNCEAACISRPVKICVQRLGIFLFCCVPMPSSPIQQ